ncbi:inositol monophosphatase [Cytobacillus suaedae]|nr:inositol monophosphatase [Cytobacillus suaedae]
MDLDSKELGQFASEIVSEAGQLLLKLRNDPLDLEEKRDHADLVTVVDSAVERFLVDKIVERYPSHGIVGEEGVFETNVSHFDTQWIIDPIDGTTNFIHNFPYYGISVGIVHKGIGVIGVVYNPSTNELYFAEKGHGAYVNGEKLSLDKPMLLKEALVSSTMFWEDSRKKDAIHPSLLHIYKNTRGLRLVGGAAISLCEIAKGTLSAYVAPMLSTWDYAGGVIVLQEAGGVITRLDGKSVSFKESGSILAANPSIHQELLSIYTD